MNFVHSARLRLNQNPSGSIHVYVSSNPLLFVRDGGTIGAMTSIEKVLRCPVLFLGLSLPEHGYHAPNENFDWQQASGGMVAFAKYFEEIAVLNNKKRRATRLFNGDGPGSGKYQAVASAVLQLRDLVWREVALCSARTAARKQKLQSVC